MLRNPGSYSVPFYNFLRNDDTNVVKLIKNLVQTIKDPELKKKIKDKTKELLLHWRLTGKISTNEIKAFNFVQDGSANYLKAIKYSAIVSVFMYMFLKISFFIKGYNEKKLSKQVLIKKINKLFGILNEQLSKIVKTSDHVDKVNPETVANLTLSNYRRNNPHEDGLLDKARVYMLDYIESVKDDIMKERPVSASVLSQRLLSSLKNLMSYLNVSISTLSTMISNSSISMSSIKNAISNMKQSTVNYLQEDTNRRSFESGLINPNIG